MALMLLGFWALFVCQFSRAPASVGMSIGEMNAAKKEREGGKGTGRERKEWRTQSTNWEAD